MIIMVFIYWPRKLTDADSYAIAACFSLHLVIENRVLKIWDQHESSPGRMEKRDFLKTKLSVKFLRTKMNKFDRSPYYN